MDILGVEARVDALRPRVTWSAPDVLRVTVPVFAFMKIRTLHAYGVRVDLHFDPDDMAARARWLREQDLPPDLPDDRDHS